VTATNDAVVTKTQTGTKLSGDFVPHQEYCGIE